MRYLRTIGGNSDNQVVSNIMKRVLTDNLAESYSWAGAKGKKPFKNLKFAKVVIGNRASILK